MQCPSIILAVEIVDPHVTEADIANVFAYFHAVDATLTLLAFFVINLSSQGHA